MTAVSSLWVLNQLSGMTFPEQGQAYDFMKRSLDTAGLDASADVKNELLQGLWTKIYEAEYTASSGRGDSSSTASDSARHAAGTAVRALRRSFPVGDVPVAPAGEIDRSSLPGEMQFKADKATAEVLAVCLAAMTAETTAVSQYESERIAMATVIEMRRRGFAFCKL